MVFINNILTGESIELSESVIRGHDNYFINLELPINWFNHAEKCKDCKSFLESIEKGLNSWFLQIENENWAIDLSTSFGSKHNHFDSHLSVVNVNGVSRSFLKLRIRPVDKEFFKTKMLEEEEFENYERCAVLRDVLKKIEF